MKDKWICLASAFLFFFSSGPASGLDRLPEIAAALSVANFKSEIKTLSQTVIPARQLVLPPIDFRLGTDLELEVCLEALRLAKENIPTVDKIWLQVKLYQPLQELTDVDIEKGVVGWVGELKNGLSFDCAGILLEAEETCPPELVKLVVSSLSVTLKAVQRNLLLAVGCDVAEKLGSKISVYVDRHVLDVSDITCFQSMRNLASLNLKRPTILYGHGEQDGKDQHVYLKYFLKSLNSNPEVFVLPAERIDNIGLILSTADQIQERIPLEASLLVDDQHLFALTADDGSFPPQAVYIDQMLQKVTILAEAEGTAERPRLLQFVNQIGENYTLTCFDPLNLSRREKGQVFSSGRIEWEQAFVFVQAERAKSEEVRFSDSVEVSADMDLSVEEIIARWQSYHAGQLQRLHNYVADAEMDLHFEPPGLGSGFDVSLRYRYFWKDDGSQYWEQTAQYLNGIRIKRNQSFPLPQLEPDKIVVQPMELNLTESYTYRLEGRAKVKGAECYVISLKPRPGAEEPLYSGRVWIDRYSFRRVQMLLVQDNISGSISSNTELQFFELIEAPDGDSLNLLTQSKVDQIVLAAGREFLLERRYRFDSIEINTEGYSEKLQEAFSGESPLFTEEVEGLRELVKDKDNLRIVEKKVDTFIWSLILGTIYDGTYDFPIPLLGISAMDYNFLRSGAQMSTFWAGPMLAVNLTKKTKKNLTFGSDLYVTALPRNDRVFRDGLEAEDEAVYLYSENFGIRMSWQPITDLFVKTTAYLIYEHYRAGEGTAENFVMPRSGFTFNPNLALEYAHRGYLGEFTLSHYERLGWEEWGIPGSGVSTLSSYQRIHGKLGKQFYLGNFTRFGLEAAYYTGFNLDRFSAYQPAVFSTPKVRGFPGGTVSLEKIGLVATNLGLTFFDFIRFDAYYNYAKCHEPADSGGKFDFHGLEFDFGTIGPWRSYIQGVFSFVLGGLPERYKSRWSVYVMIFFPF